MFLATVLLLTCEGLPQRAGAEEPPRAPAARERVLPTAAAVVPGFLLHGSGSFVAGRRTTAKRLLIAGSVGLAAFVLSGALLAGTGTSRRLVGPVAPVMAAGTGIFLTGWLADIYGAATAGRAADAGRRLPGIELDLGHRYVYDPQFAYRNLAAMRADLRYRRLRVSPAALVALDDDNQRLSLELGYRLRGRLPDERSRDGSHLELAGALLHHRYGREQFSVWTPSFALEGRLDLHHVGPSLRGSFVEGQLGAGLELYDFEVPGVRPRDSAFGLLLARFGFGVYFGGAETRSGELSLYYDHRHDDYAAGLGIRGIGGGVLGHLGLAGHGYFHESWGVSAIFEIGSAVFTGVGLRYRRRST